MIITSEQERSERMRVIEAAQGWIGTPYRHRSALQGRAGGVDCIMLIAQSFARAGLIERPAIPHYPQDWHLHRAAERYLAGLLRHTAEVPDPRPSAIPLPGDIALWRFGRCFSHGAIVVAWPVIVHAYIGQGCVRENTDCAPWLMRMGRAERPVRFFSFWAKREQHRAADNLVADSHRRAP